MAIYHSVGRLGEFDYDDTEFEISNSYFFESMYFDEDDAPDGHEHLQYIGMQTV